MNDNLIKEIKYKRTKEGLELEIEFKDNQTPEELEEIKKFLFGITDEE